MLEQQSIGYFFQPFKRRDEPCKFSLALTFLLIVIDAPPFADAESGLAWPCGLSAAQKAEFLAAECLCGVAGKQEKQLP
jgi:hypothetical protein